MLRPEKLHSLFPQVLKSLTAPLFEYLEYKVITKHSIASKRSAVGREADENTGILDNRWGKIQTDFPSPLPKKC